MKIKNDLGIDWIIAGWLASNTYTGSNCDGFISASSFCRSVRQNVLGRLIEKNGDEDPVDISTMLKANVGTALHRDIQAVWENPVVITEALKALGYTDTQIKNIHVINVENLKKETKLNTYSIKNRRALAEEENVSCSCYCSIW